MEAGQQQIEVEQNQDEAKQQVEAEQNGAEIKQQVEAEQGEAEHDEDEEGEQEGYGIFMASCDLFSQPHQKKWAYFVGTAEDKKCNSLLAVAGASPCTGRLYHTA